MNEFHPPTSILATWFGWFSTNLENLCEFIFELFKVISFLSTMVQITIKPFIWGIICFMFSPMDPFVPPKKILFSPPNCTLSVHSEQLHPWIHRLPTCSKHPKCSKISVDFHLGIRGSRKGDPRWAVLPGVLHSEATWGHGTTAARFGKRCKKRGKLGPNRWATTKRSADVSCIIYLSI